MICAIYERRPASMRNITDPRTARPVGTFEFEDKLRHNENIAAIRDKLKELGHKMASTPNKVKHPDFDFVVYVEPSTPASPAAAIEALKKGALKKKAVRMVGASAASRRLPLPRSRRR